MEERLGEAEGGGEASGQPEGAGGGDAAAAWLGEGSVSARHTSVSTPSAPQAHTAPATGASQAAPQQPTDSVALPGSGSGEESCDVTLGLLEGQGWLVDEAAGRHDPVPVAETVHGQLAC